MHLHGLYANGGKPLKPVTICVTCLMAFSLSLFFPPSLRAQYVNDGAAVATAPNGQWVEDIAADGAGGAIIVWEDWRGTSIDIYAQRVNDIGYTQWTTDGIIVCSADGQQQYPRIVPTGAGGVIIVWSDSRSDSYVIYGQRVDALGNTLWAADGVPLSTGDGWQQYPVVVPEGTGGAIVFWQAGIGSAADIYVQRINADGATQWTALGNAVCTAPGMQDAIYAIPHGAGEVIAIWTDRRNGNDDIYAQRIDAGGTARWTAGGVAICSAAQDQASGGIVDDGAGGALIVWTDYRNGSSWEVYAQRIDSLGNAQLAADGVYVPTRPGDAADLGIAPDGSGGAFMAWIAAGSMDSLIAGRIDRDATVLWTAPLSPEGTASVSNLISDGMSGSIIVWETNGDIYSQRIDAGGAVSWPAGGVAICTATDVQQYPVAAVDGAGGLIASWWDLRNSAGSPFEGDVYAGRVNLDGDIVATMLKNFTAYIDENKVVLQWTLSAIDEGAEFVVLRAEIPGDEYIPITGSVIERSGLSFLFTDGSSRPGRAYRYRVDVVDADGRSSLFESDDITVPPAAAILHQNHPNPFNPSTTITYFIPEDARVTIEIFDVEGKSVVRLVDAHQKQGRYVVRWNGLDGAGEQVDTGVYLYRLTSGKHRVSRKMVIMR